MTSPSTGGSVALVQSFRLLAFALVSGILFMGVALAFILKLVAPPVIPLVLLLVVGVLTHLWIGATTARIRPLTGRGNGSGGGGGSGGDATVVRAEALASFRNRFTVRIVLSETPALLGIVLAFVFPPRAWLVYAVGAVISWTLVALHVWPTRRALEPIIDALESGGADSGLRELFGFGPGSPAG